MNRRDKCVACGHRRHRHVPEKSIAPEVIEYVGGRCRDCPCKAWQEPRPQPKP